MIKFIALITRKDGMAFDAFDTHWRDVHGPLIAQAPGLRRYVQSHLVNDLGPEYPQAFDGMSEAWFDDLDAFVKAFRSDACRRRGRAGTRARPRQVAAETEADHRRLSDGARASRLSSTPASCT